GGPDLTIAKSDGRSNALAGDILTYTISYNNLGGTTATNVRLTETLPSNTAFIGPAGWNFAGGATYTRALSNVNPGFAGSAQFIVLVNGNAPTGPLTNTVHIGASNETGPALKNNTATDVDSVGTENLRMRKDAGDGVGA